MRLLVLILLILCSCERRNLKEYSAEEVINSFSTVSQVNKLSFKSLEGSLAGQLFVSSCPEFSCRMIGVVVKSGRFVDSIQPVFSKGGDEEYKGLTCGGGGGGETIAIANAGYVVAGFSLKFGIYVDRVRVLFAREGTYGLNMNDTYYSDWIGGDGGQTEKSFDSGGRPVVGIWGRNASYLNALGLVVKK